MAEPATAPIRASTQEHLDIEDITDNIVVLKDGGAALILETTALNFGLLSETEQDATIYAYAGLLNSLTFPIQVVIRSQRKDITSYLDLLKDQEARQPHRLLKAQIAKYRTFVEETVKKRNVLDKKFYLIIPMTAIEVGAARAAAGALKRRKGLPFPKEYILEKAKTILIPKRDHLIRQLSRLGLKSRQLATQELISLFYEIYNPGVGHADLAVSEEYQAPMVRPAIAGAPARAQAAPPPPPPLEAAPPPVIPQGTTPASPVPPAPTESRRAPEEGGPPPAEEPGPPAPPPTIVTPRGPADEDEKTALKKELEELVAETAKEANLIEEKKKDA